MRGCVVCGGPLAGLLFCRPCARSYDRLVDRTSSLDDIVIWAAARARKAQAKQLTIATRALAEAVDGGCCHVGETGWHDVGCATTVARRAMDKLGRRSPEVL